MKKINDKKDRKKRKREIKKGETWKRGFIIFLKKICLAYTNLRV